MFSMTDIVYFAGSPSYGGNTEITSVTFDELVTHIPDDTFSGCTSLTTVTIPSTVTNIGSRAFQGCESLATIVLPDSVTSLGTGVFQYCVGLSAVTLPAGLTTIPVDMFDHCVALPSLDLPDTLTSISATAFRMCGLTELTVPDGVHTLGDGALRECTYLESVSLPGALTTVGADAFFYCTMLAAVTLRGAVVSPALFTSNTFGYAAITIYVDSTAVRDALLAAKTDSDNNLSVTLAAASAGGDPYLFPVHGPAIKLPNADGVYRLYQDNDVILNAEVARASPDVAAAIRAAASIGIDDHLEPIANTAFFFTRVWLATPDGSESVLVDLEHKSTTGSTGSFRVSRPYLDRTPCPYAAPGGAVVSVDITWRRMTLTVSFHRHPQVQNGLRLRPEMVRAHADGLLLRNYRPRLFMVPSLRSTAPVRIRRSCARALSRRGTAGHREAVVTVH